MDDHIEISEELVRELIQDQFPQWSHLLVVKLEPGGWDNRTFRLGDRLLIRVPSAKIYENQVEKEQIWLPMFQKLPGLSVPEPVGHGKPCVRFDRPWSVMTWIEGKSLRDSKLSQDQMNMIAKDLAVFLSRLQKIDSQDGPKAGVQNFFRGSHLKIYEGEAKNSFFKMADGHVRDLLLEVWNKACSGRWNFPSVWVHGDISSGNLLIEKGQLTAVIDFGCLGVGDPACDYMIAWTGLNQESRNLFRLFSGVDDQTWDRARGWALWKTMQTSGPESEKRDLILREIIDDFCR